MDPVGIQDRQRSPKDQVGTQAGSRATGPDWTYVLGPICPFLSALTSIP
eukprot:gene7677-2754_t